MPYTQVKTATFAAVTISNPGTSTFGGKSLSNGEFLGLPNQGIDTGVWVFNGFNQPLTRPAVPHQYDGGNVLDNAAAIWVTGGDYAGKVYGLDTARKVVVDDASLGSHTLVEVALPPVQVRVATTALINLSSPGATIDDVTMVVGDLVLVQHNGVDDGFYHWNGSSVPMTRSPEPLVPNRTVRISEGALNAHGYQKLVNQGVVQVGTTAPLWSNQVTTVNARDFGARGDANLDSPDSGTDDTAALQAAIEYCLGANSTLRPHVLYIPAGTYRIMKPLRIMTPGTNGRRRRSSTRARSTSTARRICLVRYTRTR